MSGSKPRTIFTNSRERRKNSRKVMYLGEGLSVLLRHGESDLVGEAIDVSVRGMSVALTASDVALPNLGDVVSIAYPGRAHSQTQLAEVVHLGEGRISGRVLPRVGLEFALPEGSPQLIYDCPPLLLGMAEAHSDLHYREVMHFQVHGVGPAGMRLVTSARNQSLLQGHTLDLEVSLPLVGKHRVHARVASVLTSKVDANRYDVTVEYLDCSPIFAFALGEYCLIAHRNETPATLRAKGFFVKSADKATSYDYARSQEDFDAIRDVRLLANQAEGLWLEKKREELATPFDAHARHIICRFGGKVVGTVRLIFVDSVRERSEYCVAGGHVVPEEIWQTGFVESGAGAMDPSFQGTGLFLGLMQHSVRAAIQAGYRFMVGACPEHLVPMYTQMGFKLLEARQVTPKPGWSFVSHLFVLDLDEERAKLVTDEKSVRPAFIPVYEFTSKRR